MKTQGYNVGWSYRELLIGYKVEIPIDPDKSFCVINRRGQIVEECETFKDCKDFIDAKVASN